MNHSIVIAKTRLAAVEGCTYAWAKENLDWYHDIEDGPAIIIVLTIAHLDHDPGNNFDSNLAALCQKCHNSHDAAHRAATRRRTKRSNEQQSEILFP